MPAPTIEPTLRGPVEPLGQRDLPVGQRVWVHREGSWRPGVVLSAAGSAVMVRYRPTDARGTGVDTVTTALLALRHDTDPCIDRPPVSGSALQRRPTSNVAA